MLSVKLSVACLLLWSLTKGQGLPPGIIQVESVFIDQTEITNVHWLEYLQDLKRSSGQASYESALPDTTIWEQVYDGDLAMAFSKSYLRSLGFQNFPVVGITYDQAKAYCDWRSKIVNRKMTDLKVRYRLPTPSEWHRVAQRSLSFQLPDGHDDLDKMKFPRSNLVEIKELSGSELSISQLKRSIIDFYKRNIVLLFENLDTTEDYEFKPYLGIGQGPRKSLSSGGVSDLRGNVSEMTAEKGIAMGGNWSSTYERSSAYIRFEYTKPSVVLGFRCACDIVKK
ncbi:SUMF1/EgtB/PvdOfamily nonheme iron enzyme [Fulvivirga sp. M361]|uniref:formylglycine-generating enzyme family protein n=1 Tax=Fulvivirga sp. M361 TaxID=2594266 RepID=UPI00117A7699|nr:SUMF1/EgtB/PvdO family nonheme iron enzyme [Fulvivirga sp. M361]TRX51616.1 SUMF1/EgtB/PvdOfamily nonheme iron enzyme [Fulvivirga sp. M361]